MINEEFNELARNLNIEFSQEEKLAIIKQLDGMVDLINYLENINTRGLEIMIDPLEINDIY